MLFSELLKLPYDLCEGRFCQLCVMTCSLAVEREVAKFREAATPRKCWSTLQDLLNIHLVYGIPSTNAT